LSKLAVAEDLAVRTEGDVVNGCRPWPLNFGRRLSERDKLTKITDCQEPTAIERKRWG